MKGGSSDLDVNLRTDGHGGPLRRKFLRLLSQNTTLTHEQVKNGFPSASEYYTQGTELIFTIDDSAALLGDSPTVTSLWDNLVVSKKLAAVVSVVSGSSPHAKVQLANLTALFSRRPYSTILRRVLVLDSTPDLMNAIDKSIFKSVGISTAPLADIAKATMIELACDIVHLFTHRVRTLTTTLSSEYVMTPLEYSTGTSVTQDSEKKKGKTFDSGRSSLSSIVVKDVPAKTISGRACKQRGDVLMQLGVSSAALQAYGQVANVDNLWAASTIEALAAARYMENAPLLTRVAEFRKRLTDFRDPELRPKADLMEVEATVFQVKSRLELVTSSGCFGKTGVLPTTTRQRVTKEVEEPLQQTVRKWKTAVDAAKQLVEDNQDDEDDANNEMLHQRLIESRTLFDLIVSYVYLELELYLQEAYFLYPGVRSGANGGSLGVGLPGGGGSGNGGVSSSNRLSLGGASSALELPNDRGLVGFEIELLLKLASIRAEQGSCRSLLQCVGTISEACQDLAIVAPNKALAVQRRLPSLCYQCGTYRKAIFYAQQSASKDKAAGLHGHALAQLITACRWAQVPISIDEERGTLRLDRDFKVCSVNSSRQATLPDNEVSTECTKTSSFASVRVQASLLLELLGVLRQIQDKDEREWGVACHVAGLLLFKFSDYIGDVGQQKLRFILQSCSSSLPSHIRPAIVSPDIIKSLRPLSLPAHLIPQKQHISGVKFIRANTKMERLCLGGLLLASPVLWVVGEVASVEITMTNPFLCALMITSLSLRCSLKPLPDKEGVGGESMRQIAVSGAAASPYVTRGIILQQQSSEVVITRILPERPGILVLEGADVRIGQFEFKTPISVDVPHVEIPVMPKLPLVTCTLTENEAEVFLKQEHHFSVTVHNIGELDVDHVRVSVHKSDCTITDCDGCCEIPVSLDELDATAHDAKGAAHPHFLSPKDFLIAQQRCQVARKNGDVMLYVDRTDEMKVSKFEPGSQYSAKITLYPPTHLRCDVDQGKAEQAAFGGHFAALGCTPFPRRDRADNGGTAAPSNPQLSLDSDAGYVSLKNGIARDTVIIRVDYFQDFEPPAPPADITDMNTPTYAPIPRRIHETRLRIYLIPSVEVTGITFSSDRRFLVAHIKNACQVYPIVVHQHHLVSFENQTSVLVLPSQEVAVRLAISRLPVGVLGFPCVWHVQDRPDVSGILHVDLSRELEGLHRAEPLEDATLKVYGLQTPGVGRYGVLPSQADVDLEEVLLWTSNEAERDVKRQAAADADQAADEISFFSTKRQPAAADISKHNRSTPWSTKNASFATNTVAGADYTTDRDGMLTATSPDSSPESLTRFPLCEPVEVQLVITAPWRSTMVVDLVTSVTGDPDAVLITGPTATTWALGGTSGELRDVTAGNAELVLNFHIMIVTPGIHNVQFELRDKEGRRIYHIWGILGEFADYHLSSK